MTSDSVKGSLTLRLKDVPWDQALDIIASAKNLAIRRSGYVVTGGPADEVAAKEKAAFEASKVAVELEPLASELIQINYAKAEDVAKLLKSIKAVDPGGAQGAAPFSTTSVQKLETEANSLLSPRGQVTVDVRTNSLLIQDIPSKIREVRKLISQIDQPVRQVMIETRLVQAADTFARNLGVRWSMLKWVDPIDGANVQPWGCGSQECMGKLFEGLTKQTTIPWEDTMMVSLPAQAIRGTPAGRITAGARRGRPGLRGPPTHANVGRRGPRSPAALVRRTQAPLSGYHGARYLGSGHLVFLRRGALFAVAFDLPRLELRGTPVPVVESVAQALASGFTGYISGAGQFSVASNGALAFVRGTAPFYIQRRVATVDRAGRVRPLDAPTHGYQQHTAISPDGRQLAVVTHTMTERTLWAFDLRRGNLTRLTTGGEAVRPAWTSPRSPPSTRRSRP